MEQVAQSKPAFKLNYKRTFLIGFAFFGILLLWQVYDSWCPTFLSELFVKMSNPDFEIWRTTAAELSNQARIAVSNGDFELAQSLAAQAEAYIKQCNAAVEDKL